MIGLFISVATTWGMGEFQSMQAWLVLRFLSGTASAVVFVIASSIVLDCMSEIQAGIVYGGVIELGVATAVYNKFMSVGESSKVASFTFLVPVLAVGVGLIFLGEAFTISIFGGLVLIFASMYLINSKNIEIRTNDRQ